jgi:tripartite-type tricarboxylate transporter receptor subunit TctC
MLVGQPAGGSIDSVARLVVGHMKGYAPAVIVENRPGASSRLALAALKDSRPDGTVMALSAATAITMFPFTYQRLAYDPRADFAPVVPVCALSFVVMIGPMVPLEVKTLEQFVTWCKSNPQGANFGSPGIGSLPSFIALLLAREIGMEWRHVPYAGAAPAMQDLVGGHIAAYVGVASNAIQYANTPGIRTLAVTSPQRNSLLPDVPTMVELGYKKLEMIEWVGVFVPKKVPATMVAALASSINNALDTDEVRQGTARLGLDLMKMTTSQFARLVDADTVRWRTVVRDLGFQALQ